MILPVALLAAMGLSTVAIDLPAETEPEATTRVVDSCNAALGAQRCEAALPNGNGTTLLAVVRMQGAVLDVQLFQQDAAHTELEQRSIEFSEADTATDRYIAAGLMVAALTAAQPESSSSEPEQEPEHGLGPKPELERQQEPEPELGATPQLEPEPNAIASQTEASSAPPIHVGLDAALQLGQGLHISHPRWGGMLGLWWMAHSPRIGVSGMANYLVASDQVQLTWISGSFGLVTRLTEWNSAVNAMVSAEAMMQRASAAAERDGARESASLLRWGGRLGARVGLDLGSMVQPWIGLDTTLLSPAFKVSLGGEQVGAAASLRFGVVLGVTILPFSQTKTTELFE